MSSGILVEKMKEAAKIQGIQTKISAGPAKKVASDLQWEIPDVVMVGPQVSFVVPRLKESLKGKAKDGGDIPVEIIDALDYGRLNGSRALELAAK